MTLKPKPRHRRQIARALRRGMRRTLRHTAPIWDMDEGETLADFLADAGLASRVHRAGLEG